MSKSKKKPLREPVQTAIAEDAELRITIGGETYIATIKIWKELKDADPS